jgi:DNA-binding response OmpR family regulator
VRILLVEDDPVIGAEIKSALQGEGYMVEHVTDGVQALEAQPYGDFKLILLDIMLPKMDGWAVCERLRQKKVATPILMLTARDSVDDRVRGLEGGADDYLSKPFDVRELLARVKALIRRDKVHRTGKIQISDLEIDSNAKTVRRAGKDIHLTPREYSLLEALARNEGRTITREVILEGVWNNEERLENTVNFHITSLRKKVDADFEPKLIHTVHGFGYVLKSPGE